MKIKIVFILTLLFASSFFANAQLVEDASRFVEGALRFISPNVAPSVRAAALGGAYFGFADDGTSLIVNPAGITLVPVGEFGVGMNLTNHKTNNEFLGNTKKESTNDFYFTNVNFVCSISKLLNVYDDYYDNKPENDVTNVSFGIDYHLDNDYVVNSTYSGFNPFNTFIAQQASQNQEWVQATGLADSNNHTSIRNNIYQDGSVIKNGGLHSFSFGFSGDINPMFAIGGTFSIKFGSYKHTGKYFETDKDNIYNTYLIDDIEQLSVRDLLTQDLWGITGILGFQARLSHYCRLGLAVRFPTLMHDSEYFETEYNVTFDNAQTSKYLSGTMFNVYDVITPFEFILGLSGNTMGLSYSVSGSILNAASTYFSVDKENIFNYNSLIFFEELNERIEDELTTQFMVSAGIEYKIPKIPLYLRGSYTLQTSPYKDKTICGDKTTIGTGVGLLLTNDFILDESFVYTTQEYRKTNYGDESVPQYFSFYNVKYTPTNFQLGIRYRFD
jgi:hypothetical protein